MQRRSGKGITLVLVIRNDSSKSISMRSPVDILGIDLYNQAGINVMFFQRPKAFVEPPADYTSIYRTFSINSILINNRKSTLDLWREKSITLPPKSTCQINISIPQIWKPEPNRRRPPVEPDKNGNATPVLVGNYKLIASLGLTNGDGKLKFVITEPVALKYLD
jgi:hypothetical protein